MPERTTQSGVGSAFVEFQERYFGGHRDEETSGFERERVIR